MKKLMIVAAAAALAGNSYGIALTNCTKAVELDCPQVVFKVTATGKAIQWTDKEDYGYKSIAALKVSKGALVLFGTTTGDDCCYDTFSLYAQVKVGKTTKKIAFLNQEVKKWSVFGKNFDAAMNNEKTKKYTLESDFGAYIEDDSSTDVEGYDEVTGINLLATAFGKAYYNVKAAKTKTSGCQVCTITEGSAALTPGNYSGWFAGFQDKLSDDDACMTCECLDIDVFGGTWKAKYQKAWSKANGWKSAASYAFGSSILADMVEAGIE